MNNLSKLQALLINLEEIFEQFTTEGEDEQFLMDLEFAINYLTSAISHQTKK